MCVQVPLWLTGCHKCSVSIIFGWVHMYVSYSHSQSHNIIYTQVQIRTYSVHLSLLSKMYSLVAIENQHQRPVDRKNPLLSYERFSTAL